MKFASLLKSDFMKMKHTPFYWIHIFMPIIGIAMFLKYYSTVNWTSISKVNGYLQAISLVFPILIGVVTSMVVEKEAKAGKFKEMMSMECGKGTCLLSKIVFLLLLGFLSLIFSMGGFYIGFKYFLKQNTFPLNFYISATLIIFLSQIFLYLFHLWLSFKLGSGASIGMGIFETLFSTLLITGLGDGIWQFIPCAWSVRFCDNFFIRDVNSPDTFNKLANSNVTFNNNMVGMKTCIIFTIIFAIFFGIWFMLFEGRRENS